MKHGFRPLATRLLALLLCALAAWSMLALTACQSVAPAHSPAALAAVAGTRSTIADTLKADVPFADASLAVAEIDTDLAIQVADGQARGKKAFASTGQWRLLQSTWRRVGKVWHDQGTLSPAAVTVYRQQLTAILDSIERLERDRPGYVAPAVPEDVVGLEPLPEPTK